MNRIGRDRRGEASFEKVESIKTNKNNHFVSVRENRQVRMYTVTQLTPLPLYVAFWYLVSGIYSTCSICIFLASPLVPSLTCLLTCLLAGTVECDDESPATGGMVLLGSYLLHLYNHLRPPIVTIVVVVCVLFVCLGGRGTFRSNLVCLLG